MVFTVERFDFKINISDILKFLQEFDNLTVSLSNFGFILYEEQFLMK